jgi:hypothetical protein
MQSLKPSRLPPPLRYYNRQEAASYLHVCPASLDILRSTGQIKAVLRGRRVYYTEEELQRHEHKSITHIWPPKQNGKTSRHFTPPDPDRTQLHFSGQKLILTKAHHKAFTAAYQGADLEAEYLKMDAWLVTNKRGYRDFGRFANNWLNRMRIPQDRRPSHEYRTIKQRIIEARQAQERERNN